MENCHTWIIISMWQNDLHTNTSRSVWPILYGLMIKMLQYKMYPAGELAVLRQLLLWSGITICTLITALCAYVFQNTGKISSKFIHLNLSRFKEWSANNFSRVYLMMLMRYFFSDFLYKSIFFIKAYVVGTHLNCPNLLIVEAIQMSTNNICFYKEVDENTQAVIWTLRNFLTVCL